MNTKQAGYELGVFHGALKNGRDPIQAQIADATDEVLEDHYRKKAHSKTMKAAWDLLASRQRAHTKVARFLHALSTVERDHSSEIKQASDMVFDIVAGFEKRAVSGGATSATIGALGALAELGVGTLGATAAIGGAGLGGLYWLAKRDSQEDSAENQAKKNKIKYYNDLAQELEQRMKRKYDNEESYSA